MEECLCKYHCAHSLLKLCCPDLPPLPVYIYLTSANTRHSQAFESKNSTLAIPSMWHLLGWMSELSWNACLLPTSTCLSFAVAQRVECQESQKPGKESGDVHLKTLLQLHNIYRDGVIAHYNYVHRSGYWSGNRTPIPVAIGPAIGHVRACHSRGAKVTVSVVSTTARLTVFGEHSIDLATVGRTMMEASLAYPDRFRRGLDTRD